MDLATGTAELFVKAGSGPDQPGPGNRVGRFNGRRVSGRAASACHAPGLRERLDEAPVPAAAGSGRSLRSRLVGILRAVVRGPYSFVSGLGRESSAQSRPRRGQADEARRSVEGSHSRGMPVTGEPSSGSLSPVAGEASTVVRAGPGDSRGAREDSGDIRGSLCGSRTGSADTPGFAAASAATNDAGRRVSAGDEEMWAEFAMPAPTSSGLEEALRNVNQELVLLEASARSGLDAEDPQGLPISPAPVPVGVRTCVLKSLRGIAGWLEASRANDKQAVNWLKRFDGGTLDENAKRLLAAQLLANRKNAFKIQNRALPEMERLKSASGMPAEGLDLARALKVRFEEVLEELWQLHLLGAWAGVESERDCLFWSPWINVGAAGESPGLDGEQRASESSGLERGRGAVSHPGATAAASNPLAGETAGPDDTGGGLPLPWGRPADMMRSAMNPGAGSRDTSSERSYVPMKSAMDRPSSSPDSLRFQDGPMAGAMDRSESLRGSPARPVDDTDGAVRPGSSSPTELESRDGPAHEDHVLGCALELLEQSEKKPLAAEQRKELLMLLLGPTQQAVSTDVLRQLRAVYESGNAAGLQASRTRDLLNAYQSSPFRGRELDRLVGLLEANSEIASRLKDEAIPALQRLERSETLAREARILAQLLGSRCNDRVTELDALELKAGLLSVGRARQ